VITLDKQQLLREPLGKMEEEQAKLSLQDCLEDPLILLDQESKSQVMWYTIQGQNLCNEGTPMP